MKSVGAAPDRVYPKTKTNETKSQTPYAVAETKIKVGYRIAFLLRRKKLILMTADTFP